MTPSRQQMPGLRQGPVVPLDPSGALVALADELREEGPVIAPHVADPEVAPALGLLVAAGPRCASAPAAYATVIESVREGYLLHYGSPRLLAALDPDLRLLIGDHLYARGIERLVVIDDMLAVAELAGLISMTAQLRAAYGAARASSEAAWLASVVTIATGPDPEHERAKEALSASGEARAMWSATEVAAARHGLFEPLAAACEAVGFAASDLG